MEEIISTPACSQVDKLFTLEIITKGCGDEQLD